MSALRPLVAWFLILLLAMANGIFREAVLLPNLRKVAAFVLSGILLSSCILLVAVLLARWLALRTASRCAAVGSLWLCLTLAFEFGFGRMVLGRPWEDLLAAYTFKDGNIWPVVLVLTFCAPFFAAWMRAPDGRMDGSSGNRT